MHESEETITRIAANAVCKCVLYITIAVLLGYTYASRQLDSLTIEDCQAACNNASTQMESVTRQECTCIGKGETASNWVLPR